MCHRQHSALKSFKLFTPFVDPTSLAGAGQKFPLADPERGRPHLCHAFIYFGAASRDRHVTFLLGDRWCRLASSADICAVNQGPALTWAEAIPALAARGTATFSAWLTQHAAAAAAPLLWIFPTPPSPAVRPPSGLTRRAAASFAPALSLPAGSSLVRRAQRRAAVAAPAARCLCRADGGAQGQAIESRASAACCVRRPCPAILPCRRQDFHSPLRRRAPRQPVSAAPSDPTHPGARLGWRAPRLCARLPIQRVSDLPCAVWRKEPPLPPPLRCSAARSRSCIARRTSVVRETPPEFRTFRQDCRASTTPPAVLSVVSGGGGGLARGTQRDHWFSLVVWSEQLARVALLMVSVWFY